MTATWGMESTTADGKRVMLSYYSGRSGPPPSYIRLEGSVFDGNNSSTERFNNQEDADEWAIKLGVERWLLVQHTRAFPEAALIPISFAEAPSDERLHELISRFDTGTPLDKLTDGVMVDTGDRQFQVPPNLLRLWLIGVSPAHPAVQRLKRKR